MWCCACSQKTFGAQRQTVEKDDELIAAGSDDNYGYWSVSFRLEMGVGGDPDLARTVERQGPGKRDQEHTVEIYKRDRYVILVVKEGGSMDVWQQFAYDTLHTASHILIMFPIREHSRVDCFPCIQHLTTSLALL